MKAGKYSAKIGAAITTLPNGSHARPVETALDKTITGCAGSTAMVTEIANCAMP